MWRLLVGVWAALSLAPSAASATFGLAGEWRLDEGGGLAVLDSSGAGHGGQIGVGGSAPQWVDGIDGHALRFDGDDEVRMPDSAGLEPARITVEAWVRNAGTPGSYRYVVSKGATGCEHSSYGIYTASGGGLAFYVAGASGYAVSAQAPAGAVWDGAWHHAAGSYDGAGVRFYVDGRPVGSGHRGPESIIYGLPSKNLLLGTYRGGCNLPFVGDIDLVRVWNTALAPAEVAVAAAQPQGRPAPAPSRQRAGEPRAGAPAPNSSGPAASAGCLTVVASQRRLRGGRQVTLTVTVRRGARRITGVRVQLSGKGTRKRTRRTDRMGRVQFVVSARRRGTLRLRALGQRASCRDLVVRVR